MALDRETQETIDEWTAYLDHWERDFWPLFKARGFAHDAAFQIWMLNRLTVAVHDLDQPDEKEEWEQQ